MRSSARYYNRSAALGFVAVALSITALTDKRVNAAPGYTSSSVDANATTPMTTSVENALGVKDHSNGSALPIPATLVVGPEAAAGGWGIAYSNNMLAASDLVTSVVLRNTPVDTLNSEIDNGGQFAYAVVDALGNYLPGTWTTKPSAAAVAGVGNVFVVGGSLAPGGIVQGQAYDWEFTLTTPHAGNDIRAIFMIDDAEKPVCKTKSSTLNWPVDPRVTQDQGPTGPDAFFQRLHWPDTATADLAEQILTKMRSNTRVVEDINNKAVVIRWHPGMLPSVARTANDVAITISTLPSNATATPALPSPCVEPVADYSPDLAVLRSIYTTPYTGVGQPQVPVTFAVTEYTAENFTATHRLDVAKFNYLKPTVGGCAVDADCSPSQFCNMSVGLCASKLPNGTALPTDTAHTSPILDGQCSAPAAALVCSSGVCEPTDDKCGLIEGSACGSDNTVCRSGVCLGGVCSGCSSDSDCGNATSGMVCTAPGDAGAASCQKGCRGTGGNGCPSGQVCSSKTSAVGTCVDPVVPDAGPDAVSASDAGSDARPRSDAGSDASIAPTPSDDEGTLQGGGFACSTRGAGNSTGTTSFAAFVAVLLSLAYRKRAADRRA